MVKVEVKGDFKNTLKYIGEAKKKLRLEDLDKYGKEGVAALMSSTPIDTGLTAMSWYYKIERTQNNISINFYNSNVVKYVPIAIILQYGHSTRNGGWVEGRDYINPAIQPIFDKIVDKAWREVTEL